MAKLLYKLGFWATNHAKAILFSAVALLLAVGVAVLVLWFDFDDDMSIPGTSAQNTIEMLEEEFPEVGKAGAQLQVVFKAPEGKTLLDPEVQGHIAKLVEEVQALDGVEAVYTPEMLQNYNADQTLSLIHI